MNIIYHFCQYIPLNHKHWTFKLHSIEQFVFIGFLAETHENIYARIRIRINFIAK